MKINSAQMLCEIARKKSQSQQSQPPRSFPANANTAAFAHQLNLVPVIRETPNPHLRGCLVTKDLGRSKGTSKHQITCTVCTFAQLVNSREIYNETDSLVKKSLEHSKDEFKYTFHSTVGQ
jgi:hypothetical protein